MMYFNEKETIEELKKYCVKVTEEIALADNCNEYFSKTATKKYELYKII